MWQRIYPDCYGIDTWDASHAATMHVHIANSMMWREITGEEPPPTPVSARTYTEYGLPWFEMYDEHRGDIAPSAELAGVKSVKDIDAAKRISTPRSSPNRSRTIQRSRSEPTRRSS
jgi:hypothetical protein